MPFNMKKWLIRAGLVFLAGLVVSTAYGHFSMMGAKPPFRMITVEPGRALHAHCEGPEDAPFVLYDAGAFGIYADGWWIKEALKSDMRVCLYDRAGMGWSDPVPAGEAPSAKWHVEDMRRLAAALGARAPYYLVGHSMAGLRLHVYANTYREELAGLVFIDAARPQNFDLEKGPPRWVHMVDPVMRIGAFAARIGLARMVATVLSDPLDLPNQQAQDKRRALSLARHYNGSRAELMAALNDVAYYADTYAERLPVSVFSASANGGNNAQTARAAEGNVGFGRLNPRPEENHVSLLARPMAEQVAGDVRAMVDFRERRSTEAMP